MKNKVGVGTIFFVLLGSFLQYPDVTGTTGPLKLFEDRTNFDSIGYDNCNMMTNGEYAVLSNLIKPNNTVFDVGANKGEWSLHALSITKSLQLHAFEPIPQIYRQLKNNLSKYAVSLNNSALSCKRGNKQFFYYNKSNECSSLYRRADDIEQRFVGKPEIMQVALETLETFCLEHNIQHIDFLKIDTEGSELDVLYGARNLLADQKIDIIQFEYGGTYRDAGITLEQVLRFLTIFDYKLYRIHPDGLIQIHAWRDQLETYRYSNYLAVSCNTTKILFAS